MEYSQASSNYRFVIEQVLDFHRVDDTEDGIAPRIEMKHAKTLGISEIELIAEVPIQNLSRSIHFTLLF